MSFEVKKHGLRQLSETGEWVLSLKLHPHELPIEVMKAPMGQRYGLALVEIAHDETESPVETGSAQAPAEPANSDPRHLSKTAALLCQNMLFWRFLEQQAQGAVIQSSDAAAQFLRNLCMVQSRSEFDKDQEAAERWKTVHGAYEIWKQAA